MCPHPHWPLLSVISVLSPTLIPCPRYHLDFLSVSLLLAPFLVGEPVSQLPFHPSSSGPSPTDTSLWDHQLLSMVLKHCRADWGPVFSSLIAPQALLTVSSVGFSLISLKLCAVSQGCFNEPHFFRTNCSSSSQHIGAPGFSLFSAALTSTPKCTFIHTCTCKNQASSQHAPGFELLTDCTRSVS